MSGVIFFEAVSKAARNKNKDHQGDSQLELLTIFFLYGGTEGYQPPKIEFVNNKGGGPLHFKCHSLAGV